MARAVRAEAMALILWLCCVVLAARTVDSQAVSARCRCRNVGLRWCDGRAGCSQGLSLHVSACSTVVFVNELRRDYTVRVRASTGRTVREVSISRRAGQKSLGRFDTPGRYGVEVIREANKRRAMIIQVSALPADCPRTYCVDSESGDRYNPGQRWTRDTCTGCSCTLVGTRPRVQCAVDPCGAKRCLGGYQPAVKPGQCCPQCPSVCWNSGTSRYVLPGTGWRETCHLCLCSGTDTATGNKQCRRFACPQPTTCPGGRTPRQVTSTNPCCPAYECDDASGTCTHNGGEYNPGDQWEDGCRDCECRAGQVSCQPRACPTQRCRDVNNRPVEAVRQRGDCCATCPSCGRDPATGQLRRPGSVVPAEEPCTQCTCNARGQSDCWPQGCPPPPPCPVGEVAILDTSPRPSRGECCATYRCVLTGCTDAKNVTRESGTTWRNKCETCRCDDRQAICFPDSCPPPPACPGGQLPLLSGTNGCCDTFSCPPCCHDMGKSHAEGKAWTREHEPCLECRCTNCGVVCGLKTTCPALSCIHGEEPLHVPGQCCPTRCRRLCPWQCGEQLYSVQFRPMFDRRLVKYPAGGRLTKLLLLAHDSDFTLWEEDTNASLGLIKYVRKEVDTLLSKELSFYEDHITRTLSVGASANPQSHLLSVDHRHAIVSGISGILPSPDWFTGMTHGDLCDGTTGRWRKTVTFTLRPYDAGINQSRKFIAKRKDRSALMPVVATDRLERERKRFFGITTRTDSSVQPIGRVIFERLSDGCPVV